MLQAIGVEKYFRGPHGKLDILRGVDLELHRGDLAFILGRSGAGKSTLLYLLGGLDKPSKGKVEFKGKNIGSLWERQLAEYRNQKIGFVFQFFHLLPELSVKENVALPSLIRGKTDHKRAQSLLERVGLWNRRDHLPKELSGGEQQRVAIARALINEPEIVLCDEPTGNLDEETADSVLELIQELNREGQTFCIVTHEQAFARKSDRVYRLQEGVVAQNSQSTRSTSQ
jgi:lipoprotein-releasing system ATP-binding protein